MIRLPAAVGTRAGFLTSLSYAAVFFAFGAHLPFWPVWLADWGLEAEEIARFLGLAMFARLLSATALPLIADRLAMRRAIFAFAAVAAALIILLHLVIDTRAALLAATVAMMLTMSGLLPLSEALGVRASVNHGFPYAHARAAGSLAFLAAAGALGWMIDRTGPDAVVWTVATSLLVAAAVTLAHPGGGAPPGQIDHSRFGEAAALAVKPVFLAFAVAYSIGQASHAVYYVYGTLAWQAQGIPTGTIGLLWAIGVLAEIIFLLGPGRRLTERFGPAPMLALGAGAGALRWALTALEPPLWALWPLQGLHAFTFAAGHLGGMAFIAAAIPGRLAASAQGLVGGGLGGIAMIAATFASGEISGLAGPSSAYWLAAAMSATALVAALILHRTWRGMPLA